MPFGRPAGRLAMRDIIPGFAMRSQNSIRNLFRSGKLYSPRVARVCLFVSDVLGKILQ